MSHEPKLELYKLKLFKKEDGSALNFREFFRHKSNFYHKKVQPKTDEEILQIYFEEFINAVDLKKYNTTKSKKKAFTINSLKENGMPKSEISLTPTKKIITGILRGGKYGLDRFLDDIGDTSKGKSIKTKHIVGDKFYFLLYTPLDESTGIIMIQSYVETKISDIFRDHLLKFFKYTKVLSSKIEIYAPKIIKDKYLEEAVFKSITFTSGWSLNADFNGDMQEEEYDLQVKIQIIDKSKKKSDYKRYKKFKEILGKSIFGTTDGDKKELDAFPKVDAKMKSNGKEFSIVFDNEENITPVILLENEGIEITEGGVPIFEQIDTFSKELLEAIINEMSPADEVKNI